MSTIGLQLRDAAVTQLNVATGRPASLQTVKGGELREPHVTPTKSFIFVRRAIDEIVPVGGSRGPLRDHGLRLILDMFACGTASLDADAAVDALIVYATKQLETQTFGGLAIECVISKAVFSYSQSKEGPCCRARCVLAIRHSTRTGDAEQRT